MLLPQKDFNSAGGCSWDYNGGEVRQKSDTNRRVQANCSQLFRARPLELRAKSSGCRLLCDRAAFTLICNHLQASLKVFAIHSLDRREGTAASQSSDCFACSGASASAHHFLSWGAHRHVCRRKPQETAAPPRQHCGPQHLRAAAKRAKIPQKAQGRQGRRGDWCRRTS